MQLGSRNLKKHLHEPSKEEKNIYASNAQVPSGFHVKTINDPMVVVEKMSIELKEKYVKEEELYNATSQQFSLASNQIATVSNQFNAQIAKGTQEVSEIKAAYQETIQEVTEMKDKVRELEEGQQNEIKKLQQSVKKFETLLNKQREKEKLIKVYDSVGL